MASSDGPLSAATELLLSPVVTPALRARAGGPGRAVDDSLHAARHCAAAASSVAGELAAPNSSGYCSKPSARKSSITGERARRTSSPPTGSAPCASRTSTSSARTPSSAASRCREWRRRRARASSATTSGCSRRCPTLRRRRSSRRTARGTLSRARRPAVARAVTPTSCGRCCSEHLLT